MGQHKVYGAGGQIDRLILNLIESNFQFDSMSANTRLPAVNLSHTVQFFQGAVIWQDNRNYCYRHVHSCFSCFQMFYPLQNRIIESVTKWKHH